MRTGRPPKDPADRRTEGIRVPLTEAEKAAIESAAESAGAKATTWARDVLLRQARRVRAKSGERGS